MDRNLRGAIASLMMMDRSLRSLLVITLALAAVVSLSPGAALAKQPSACKLHGDSTEAKNQVARVFSAPREIEGDPAGSRLFGCLRSVGRPLALADAFDDGYVLSGSWSDVRLAGRFVAWSDSTTDISCKADCPLGYEPTRSSIGVADLRRRRIRRISGVVAGRGLVLTNTGAVAWAAPAAANGVAIRAWDRNGLRTLDTGAIAPASLTLDGSTISWTKAGVGSSATLR